MSRHLWLTTLLASLGGLSAAPEKAASLSPSETTEALYAIGYLAVQRLPSGYHDFTKEEVETLLDGFEATALRQPPEFEITDAVFKLDQMLGEQTQSLRVASDKSNLASLQKAASAPKARQLPSGVVYTELRPGAGPTPARTDTVRVRFKGELTNGREFDSSERRGAPAEVALDHAIGCWAEGITQMRIGGKSKLVCPPELSVGAEVQGEAIPTRSVLVFEIELLAVLRPDAGM